MPDLRSPYPWFGGKRSIAAQVWERFGDVRNFVDPFLGSLAMLLERPRPFTGTETVNDLDGFVANFWRAVQAAPDQVAHFADWPVNENDLHARHAWLVGQRQDITRRLEGDPDFYDVKIAGWWVWGGSCWIGSGFCSGSGPWHVVESDGVKELLRTEPDGAGVIRQLIYLSDYGRGVRRKIVHLGDNGKGINRDLGNLKQYFQDLSDRLRNVRVCSGDWSRVLGPTPTTGQGLTAVFLDPPYSKESGRDPNIYSQESLDVAHKVRDWAIQNGQNPLLRIALCGYEGEHAMPADWKCLAWKASGGYGVRNTENQNATRERIWFSPHCLDPESTPLFDWIPERERDHA